MSNMDVFVKPVLKRLSKAQWLDIDEEDRDAIIAMLERSGHLYYQGIGRKMQGQRTIILCLPVEEDEE